MLRLKDAGSDFVRLMYSKILDAEAADATDRAVEYASLRPGDHTCSKWQRKGFVIGEQKGSLIQQPIYYPGWRQGRVFFQINTYLTLGYGRESRRAVEMAVMRHKVLKAGNTLCIMRRYKSLNVKDPTYEAFLRLIADMQLIEGRMLTTDYVVSRSLEICQNVVEKTKAGAS